MHDNLLFDGNNVNYPNNCSCIPMYLLQCMYFDVYLECNNKIMCSLGIKKTFSKCKIAYNQSNVTTNNVKQNNDILQRINQYDKYSFKNSNEWSIPDFSNSTGFFIECDKISAISIFCGSICVMSFDEDIVDIYVKKIHSSWTTLHSIALIESLSTTLSRDIAKYIETLVDKPSLYWLPFAICKEWYKSVITCDFNYTNNVFIMFGKEQSGTLYILKKNAFIIEYGCGNVAFI